MLNKLIESIIENSNNTGFDLSKSFMSNVVSSKNYDNSLPVVAQKSTWERISHEKGAFLEKVYKFYDYEHLQYFLKEHFSKSQKMNYYPEIFIKELNIKFFLKTDALNEITEVDIEYSKFLDEIYGDIFYLR